jgi:hypothetical protein
MQSESEKKTVPAKKFGRRTHLSFRKARKTVTTITNRRLTRLGLPFPPISNIAQPNPSMTGPGLGGRDDLGSFGIHLQLVRKLEALHQSMNLQNLYVDIPQGQAGENLEIEIPARGPGENLEIEIPAGGPEEEFKVDRTLAAASGEEGLGRREEQMINRTRLRIVRQPPGEGKFGIKEDLELLDYVRSCDDGHPNTRIYWNRAALKKGCFSFERSPRARWRRYTTVLSHLTKSEISRARVWALLYGSQGKITFLESEWDVIPEADQASPEV